MRAPLGLGSARGLGSFASSRGPRGRGAGRARSPSVQTGPTGVSPETCPRLHGRPAWVARWPQCPCPCHGEGCSPSVPSACMHTRAIWGDPGAHARCTHARHLRPRAPCAVAFLKSPDSHVQPRAGLVRCCHVAAFRQPQTPVCSPTGAWGLGVPLVMT